MVTGRGARADASGEVFAIRTAVIDGEPWFVAIDCCRALGLDVAAGQGASNHLVRLAKDQRRVLNRTLAQNEGAAALFNIGDAQLTVISESGLYLLIMKSEKATARPFQDWVTRDVLPVIRKTGGYVLAGADRSKVAEGIAPARPRRGRTGARGDFARSCCIMSSDKCATKTSGGSCGGHA